MDCRLVVLLAFLFTNISFAQGFDDDYKIFQGDFNNDGLVDFYIRKTSIVLLHGDIITPIVVQDDGFVLEQGLDQSFTVVSDIDFQASVWTESAVELIFQDFNMDGVMDILLEGVNDGINGLNDLIVFAGTANGSPPVHVRTIDQEFKQFIGDISSWSTDPNYFYQEENFLGYQCANWDSRPVYGYYYDYFLEAEVYGFLYYIDVCVEYVPVFDLSGFNQDALSLIADLDSKADASGVWDIEAGSPTGVRISDILEDVFGTTVFGNVFKNGGLLDIEITLGIPSGQLNKDRGERLRVGLVTAGVETETISAEIRYLTPSEIVLALDNGLKIINSSQVKVIRKGLASDPFKVVSKSGHIYIPDNNTAQLLWSSDYGSINFAVSNPKRSIFVHELTHVYQWRTKGEINLFATDDYCYMPLIASYSSYNHEQRAEMVKDRFLLRLSETEYLTALIPCNENVELQSLEDVINL